MGRFSGFAVTLRQVFKPRITTKYPEEKRHKPERLHVNIEDLEAAHRGQSSWSEPSHRKNRVRAES